MLSYKSFSSTVQGISHKKEDKPCQDYSLHYSTGLLSIAIVADGHGDSSCFRSDRGAELAAKTALQSIYDFIYPHDDKKSFLFPKKLGRCLRLLPEAGTEGQKEAEAMIRTLVRNIIKTWHEKVDEDLASHPFKTAELEGLNEKYRKRYEAGQDLSHAYGTTLLAAAQSPDYTFGIHIGDGRWTALYPDGTYSQPVPWDERCYLNVTTSICDDDAADRARIWFSFNALKAPPLAVFLCSDGVDDNYPVEDTVSIKGDARNAGYLAKLYRTILETLAEDGYDSTFGGDGSGGQLKDLCRNFAEKGKGDDTSIAGFVDMKRD
jgi:serine/threonine protein phosphatase PrpC